MAVQGISDSGPYLSRSLFLKGSLADDPDKECKKCIKGASGILMFETFLKIAKFCLETAKPEVKKMVRGHVAATSRDTSSVGDYCLMNLKTPGCCS